MRVLYGLVPTAAGPALAVAVATPAVTETAVLTLAL